MLKILQALRNYITEDREGSSEKVDIWLWATKTQLHPLSVGEGESSKN